MSMFSEKLTQYANLKNVKLYGVAVNCGLDRSTVYKFLRGTREPKSLEIVIQLAKALQLDPTQTDELLEAYKVTKMGDHNYYRRKKVAEFFNFFAKKKSDKMIPIQSELFASFGNVLPSVSERGGVYFTRRRRDQQYCSCCARASIVFTE